MKPLVLAAALAAFFVPACASAQGAARSAKAEACRAEAQSRLRVGKTAGSNRGGGHQPAQGLLAQMHAAGVTRT
jgi:hypothetical protein